MRLFALVVCLLAGCIHDDLVACPDDTLCGVGLQCDTVHGGCITSDQASACIGMPDRTDCMAGDVHGYCLDQICVDPSCGNHIVESDELCDDGNHRDGDGCSAACDSRERCGDGAVDHGRGEACDDGNLQSHDGCDSRCIAETEEWSIDELGPAAPQSHHTVYDEARSELVMVTDGFLWGWNGTRWHVLADDAPTLSPFTVGYDEIRKSIVVVSGQPPNGDLLDPDPPWNQVYEWDGTTWTHWVIATAAESFQLGLTYDPVHKNLFGFGTNSTGVVAGQLDLAAKTWTPVAAPTAPNRADNGFDLAFDVKRAVVVVATAAGENPTTNPTVLEWDGTWTAKAASMAAPSHWAVYYDPLVQEVVAIGASDYNAATTPVQGWTGSAWVSLPSIAFNFRDPVVAFDLTRNVRVVFGGNDPPDTIAESAGPAWKFAPRTAPPAGVESACAFDEPRQSVLCTGNIFGALNPETWRFAGSWTLVKRGPVSAFAPLAVTYDPIRDAVIGWAPDGLQRFDGSSWLPFGPSLSVASAADAIVFDPIAKRLVGAARPQVFGPPYTILLTEDNQITTLDSAVFRGLAFDARNSEVIGIGFNGDAEHLVDDDWAPTIGPGSIYAPVTNSRRGTVEFFAASEKSVERIGTQWLEHPTAPPIPVSGSAVMNQTTGELHIIGLDGASRFMLHRRWVSSTPTEDCSMGATADLDGDGVSGCGDPDCWTTCTPACPPLVSCP